MTDLKTYLYYNQVYLDSASNPERTSPDDILAGHPDKPHAAGESEGKRKSGGSGQKGQVKISDVLAKKEGDEVWVVIKGNVYKYVSLLEQ